MMSKTMTKQSVDPHRAIHMVSYEGDCTRTTLTKAIDSEQETRLRKLHIFKQ